MNRGLSETGRIGYREFGSTVPPHRVWMLLGPLVACSVSQSLCACVNAWF